MNDILVALGAVLAVAAFVFVSWTLAYPERF